MGKALFYLAGFLLLALCSLAATEPSDSLSDARSMTAIIEISGHADIIKEASRARVESATVNLSLFPKEGDFTDIDDIEWVPKAKIIGDVAQFNFKDPQESLDYLMKAKITTSQSVVEIRDAIAFPLVSLPNEIEPYIKATKIIDSDDPAINKVASNLVQGETDLYSAVYSIAKWTRENVNYNLSSVTAEVSQKASWVLLERKGVCDEITTLFIALLRSVGIPAKFVTGYAYTTSPLFPSNWGAHGWAEVYFPSVGWVPYDITYGQFGWVDATHIRLSESKDPDDSPTRYEWVGRDSQLEIDDLHISVDVLDSSKDALSMVEVDLKASKQDIGPGSFNAIEAKVRNLRDSYAMTELTLNIPREVRVISKMTRDIMLKPHEERSVFWIVRLDSALEENYLYTYPVSVTGSWDTLDETSFSASVRSAVYSLSQIGEIVDQAQEEQEKVYSSSLSLECSPRSISLYTYEEGKIVCTAANT
ncbi:MAG TPA: transglutaminase-like domain-containing protein, partial [Candidatus Nanoarchaeia archaeon]|nr:transglutaminase-like domain-containing protein [Candidatus Nanoarchaeia archaeon]